MVFFDQDEFFQFLLDQYDPGVPVRVMTFGLYLGISNGVDYTKTNIRSDKRGELREYKGRHMPVRSFIDGIDPNDLRIIVSIPPFSPCVEDCEPCKIKYRRRLRRLRETRLWLNIPMRYTGDSHMKLYAVGDRVFTGGFNLSGSTWTDAVVEVEDEKDKRQMLQVFDAEWEQATDSIWVVSKQINEGGV